MPKKVIVIGSGPGGYPAALRLKELGAEVSIAESWDFGGTDRFRCAYRGYYDPAYRYDFRGFRVARTAVFP